MYIVGNHIHAQEFAGACCDRHHAIVSLMEELEAAEGYGLRAEACQDHELRSLLEQGRDEVRDHAGMVLEWIRRKSPGASRDLDDYLFAERLMAQR